MLIKKLRLEGYRNYSLETVDFDDKLNVITGENAQGKTNLIEAVNFLSGGRSFRTFKDAPLIQMNRQAAYITAGIESRSRAMTMEARIFLPGMGRKQFIVNGVKLKKTSELSGILGTVLFSPDDISLFRDAAARRRRFLDDAISQLSPAYAAAAEKYEKLLQRKSRILKDKDIKPSLLDTLEDYNIAMARTGSLIITQRAGYLKKLSETAGLIHRELSGNREFLQLNYKTVSNIEDVYAPREIIYVRLREHQKSHEQAELDSGTCLSGPHKDDFEALLDGAPVKTFGSQGQNRSGVVSLKLAEREILKEDLGEYPILLLDDVLSELDGGRQEFILSKIKDGQVFVTCCENERLIQAVAGKTIRIIGGSVEKPALFHFST